MSQPIEYREPCACCGAKYTDEQNHFYAIHREDCTDPLHHWGHCGDDECKGPCQYCGACTHGTSHDDGVCGTDDLTCTKCDAHYWT